MARKDSEKDSDRPHYYSQFWLDIAAGRRIIGAPRTDESDSDEGLEPVAPRRPSRSTAIDNDGYHEIVVHPQVDPELEEDADEYSTPELELDTPDITDEIEEEDIPAFGANEEDIPDVEIAPQIVLPIEETEEIEAEEPENEEEDFLDEDEDEDDDDDTWTARGRKKPKPGRQVKLPAKTPPKRAKREPRRGF